MAWLGAHDKKSITRVKNLKYDAGYLIDRQWCQEGMRGRGICYIIQHLERRVVRPC